MRERAGWLGLTLAIIVFDQVTKLLVAARMELHESRLLLDGLLSFTYVRNHGGAFGAFSDADLPYQALVFCLVSLAALSAITLYWWRTPLDNRWAQGGLALIVGGALGNLIDRARLGYVIDFVDAYWGSHHWPAFNVADAAITVGVILLLLDVLLESSTSPQTAPAGRNR